MISATTWLRTSAAAAIAGLAVVTPVEFLLLPLALGGSLLVRWSGQGVLAERVVPAAAPLAIILLAATAPVETVTDRVKSRPMSVPKLAMTVAELREPEVHGLARPGMRSSFVAPEEFDTRVVRFPSLEPTVGEFIAAIETQAGMHHRFWSCGNGWTILWGHDNITASDFVAAGQ